MNCSSKILGDFSMGEELILRTGTFTKLAVIDENNNGVIDEGELKVVLLDDNNPDGNKVAPTATPAAKEEFNNILKILRITAPSLKGVRITSFLQYRNAILNLNPEVHKDALKFAREGRIRVDINQVKLDQVKLMLQKAYATVDQLHKADTLTLAEKQKIIRPRLEAIRREAAGITNMSKKLREELNQTLQRLERLDTSVPPSNLLL